MNRRRVYQLLLWTALLVLLAMPVIVSAQDDVPGRTPLDRLTPVTAEDGRSLTVEGYQPRGDANEIDEYFVEMEGDTVVDVWTSEVGAAAVQAQLSLLQAQQADMANQISGLGGEVLADYQKVFNGLAIRISGDKVREVMALPGVVRVTLVPDYYTMLDETVDWIGGTMLQGMGVDGSGITVAVLDSGIDYTHEHLGGSGSVTDTQKAIAEASQPADPALYPTAKVIGGYDFVGSDWPAGPLVPDPNPMDDEDGSVDGHGTHVASIIGGVQTSSLGPGVAPGVGFYAVKVCSSNSTSCSGIAIMEGLEWSADPNGDNFFDDRADVVNMSLGASYGQARDATDVAVGRLAALGSVVVSSAGNSANLPYIVGSPSSARPGISVAQSSVPSAINNEIQLVAPASIAGTGPVVYYSWSGAWTTPVTGTVQYVGGTGCSQAAIPSSVAGKIALIDRGGCNFSDKVYFAQQAGAIAALVGLVDNSTPFEGSQGSFFGQITIPGFNINKATSDKIKAAQTANETPIVNLDRSIGTPLPDTMVGSSSRGPRFDLDYLKPDISAPGASISASSGQQGYSRFGGTSGASPMVAGAAALLLESAGGSGSLPPHVVKARLMNNAVTTTWEDQPGGKLNPISRQGAGRVDVYAANTAETVAWVPADRDIALSFGVETIGAVYTDTKTVQVINTGAADKSYDIGVSYRYTDDIGAGVTVTVSTPTLNVSAGGNSTFNVDLAVDPSLLKPWTLTSGSRFNDGNRLTDAEVDGFITLTETTTLSVTNVPFHFLPIKTADVTLGNLVDGGATATVSLTNTSPYTGSVEVYPLVDISPQYPISPKLTDAQPVDIQYVGVDAAVFDATAGENILLFAIGTYENRSHPRNVEHDIYIDIDQDGIDDYVAYNADLGWLTTGTFNGQQVSVLVDLGSDSGSAQFFLDSRLHSGNMVIPVVIPDNDLAFNFQVLSFDAYYGGFAWDASPADDTYHIFDAAAPAFTVDALSIPVLGNSTATSTITKTVSHRSPSQIGVLYRTFNGVEGKEMQAVTLPTTLPAGVNVSISADPITATIGDMVTANAVLTFGNNVAWPNQPVIFSDGTFTASLSGASEVPPVTTSGSGTFEMTVNPLAGRIDYTLDVTGVATVTMAHIHRGPAGANGGVAYWLYDATGARGPSGSFPVTGTIIVTSTSDLQLLLTQGLYVNVHTTAHPSGEVRGQIVGAKPAVTNSGGMASTTWMADEGGILRLWAFAANDAAFTDVSVMAPPVYVPFVAGGGGSNE